MSFTFDPDRADTRLTLLTGDLTPELWSLLTSGRTISCDLETSGLDPHQDRIGTLQFHAPSVGAVVVQVLSSRPARCIQLLESPDVVKIFHHAPFDLGFLSAAWSVRARSVRCTKIASKLAFPELLPQEHSLGPLLQRMLGVPLDKGAVRTSDWLQPELSDEQVRYAADDTRYLVPLLTHLATELTAKGRADLYRRCCEFLPTQAELVSGGFPNVFGY